MAINPNPKSEKNRINKSKESELEKYTITFFFQISNILELVWCIKNETFFRVTLIFSLKTILYWSLLILSVAIGKKQTAFWKSESCLYNVLCIIVYIYYLGYDGRDFKSILIKYVYFYHFRFTLSMLKLN